MVEDVLAAMSEILEELQGHYTGLEHLQEDVSHSGDFRELVSDLRDLEARKA